MYAVIFTSQRTLQDNEGYTNMNKTLSQLLTNNPDFVKEEGARNESGFGVSVSYWKTEAAAKAWKQNPTHLKAQQLGAEKWYVWYSVHVCQVERFYNWKKDNV